MGRFTSLLYLVIDQLLPRKESRKLVDECTPEALASLLAPVCKEDGICALLPYRHSLVRAVILEAKFHNNKKAEELLAGILQEYLHETALESESFEHTRRILVPVPLGAMRKKERGYNQVEKILMSKSLDYASPLVRVRETRPQMSLTRKERLRNVIGAFSCQGDIEPDAIYVVVDDVLTTGATIGEAVKTLQEAGARAEGLALAY